MCGCVYVSDPTLVKQSEQLQVAGQLAQEVPAAGARCVADSNCYTRMIAIVVVVYAPTQVKHSTAASGWAAGTGGCCSWHHVRCMWCLMDCSCAHGF
jgi:hypothetical protein